LDSVGRYSNGRLATKACLKHTAERPSASERLRPGTPP
jgi:hypothetical protein